MVVRVKPCLFFGRFLALKENSSWKNLEFFDDFLVLYLVIKGRNWENNLVILFMNCEFSLLMSSPKNARVFFRNVQKTSLVKQHI